MKTIILVRHSESQRTEGISNDKIPLSETGRILAKAFFERKVFQDHKCVYSSPYLRAVETAGYLSKEIVIDERLKERALGDLESLNEVFWAKQYEDLDFKNRNGESMNETSCRMDSCIGEILSLLHEGEMAVAVSHAAAICAYFTKYCTITVVNASEKIRRIQFGNETILHGQIKTPCAFVLKFEQDCLVRIEVLMDMIELRRLSVDDGNDIYNMLQEMPAEENGLINKANGLTFEEFKEWLIGKHENSEQIGIVDGWKVPSTTYWLYVDGIPVGFGSVRHFLTDALRIAGGNIGYGIAPQYRGKGYGNEILRLLLKEARKLGIDKVLVTVHTDNAASRAVALANGGIITDKTDERIHIWIDTA